MKKFLKIKLTPLLLLLTFFGCGEQEYLIVKYNEVDFNTGKTKYKGEVFTGEVLKYYSEMNDDLDPVYVDTEKQGNGLSHYLMQAIDKHPDLQAIRRFTLATSTAKWLYEKYGFTLLNNPEMMMERYSPNIYSENKND